MSEIINGANMNKSGVYPGWKAGSAGGAGGVQSVEVTPIVEEGTKIASISVDGESTDLYAPAVEAGSATGAVLPDPIAITVNIEYDDTLQDYKADKTFTELAAVIDEFSVDYDTVFIKVTGGPFDGCYAGYHVIDEETELNVVELHQLGLTALNLAYPVFEDYQLTGYEVNVVKIIFRSDNTLRFGGNTLFIQSS